MTVKTADRPVGVVERKSRMSGIFEVQHPLIANHLAKLRMSARRRKNSGFWFNDSRCFWRTRPRKIWSSPRTRANAADGDDRPGAEPTHRPVPILRAGLGMVDPVLNLIPARKFGTWAFTAMKPRLRRSSITAGFTAATGRCGAGARSDAGHRWLSRRGARDAARVGRAAVKLLAVIAAREGIDEVFSSISDTQIFVCAIDPELNAKKYIVPGLGDAVTGFSTRRLENERR